MDRRVVDLLQDVLEGRREVSLDEAAFEQILAEVDRMRRVEDESTLHFLPMGND